MGARYRVRLLRRNSWSVGATVGDLAAADRHPSVLTPAVADEAEPELRVELVDRPTALAWWFQDRPAGADHPGIGYRNTRDGARHTRVQQPADTYYGLGETSGPLVKNGRWITLDPRDACHYDPRTGDPLYKHWPVLLTRHDADTWTALVYDQPHPMRISLGSERHHYHGLYTCAQARTTWWRYLVIGAGSLPALVGRLTQVLGRPQLPPLWSLGYLASGMAYTDADDVPAALTGFADRVRAEQVPCDGIHLSSGFGLRDGRRYTLWWNPDRVPDPAALLSGLRERGLRTVVNVKPVLLTDHPAHPGLAAAGAFLRDDGDAPAVAPYWGGDGSWLDLTHPHAQDWWRTQIREQVLEPGADGVWNDNNEYAVAACTRTADGCQAHASTQILELARASADELTARTTRTGQRGLLLTRSAVLGTQQLAQTWSGDNTSDWATLTWNTPMGLGLGLCGQAATGHDIGGFHGPGPDPELLLRWVQRGIGYPRFSIHSWKDAPTEPWTHPSVAHHVRDAIRLRYRLIPYLYCLFDEHVRTGAPVQRPLMYEYPELYEDEGLDALLGPFLLLPAVARRARAHRVDLPGLWFDWHTGQAVHGPTDLPVPLERAPLLARAGAIVPVADPGVTSTADLPHDPGLLLFPAPGAGSSTSFTVYQDDGVSTAHTRGAYNRFTVTMTPHPDRIDIAVTDAHLGHDHPPFPGDPRRPRRPPGVPGGRRRSPSVRPASAPAWTGK